MPVGYLLSRMTTDTQRLADTIGWSLLDLVWGVIFLVMCSMQMFLLNAKLAAVIVLVLPPLAVISMYFQKKILAAYTQLCFIISYSLLIFNHVYSLDILKST